MARICSAPKQFPIPQLDFRNINGYREQWAAYEKQLADWCKQTFPNQDGVGEIIKFPVADGYALYMVASLKPVQLIHLEYLDAYSFQYAHRLTKKDVMEKVASERAMAKMFADRQKTNETTKDQ